MKKLLLITILFTTLSATAQTKNKDLKRYYTHHTTTGFGKYSGTVDENGKYDERVTVEKYLTVMAQYLKNNWWNTSNVYRLEYMHLCLNYTTKQDNNI
jgi:hypothetical protein